MPRKAVVNSVSESLPPLVYRVRIMAERWKKKKKEKKKQRKEREGGRIENFIHNYSTGIMEEGTTYLSYVYVNGGATINQKQFSHSDYVTSLDDNC